MDIYLRKIDVNHYSFAHTKKMDIFIKNYNMTKVLSLFIAIVLSSSVFGQDVPPLPSIEKVFQDIKNNKFVYESLKEDYHIANPKSCTFKMGSPNGEGGYADAYWSTYQSDNAYKINWKWPDDRASVYFTVITPKSTEGISYELPLLVEYSRIKNDIITNSWEYYWWMFKAPLKTIGKPKQKELNDTLINVFKGFEYRFIPNSDFGYPEDLEKFVFISEITESPDSDVTRSDSYREWMTRYYIVKGDYIRTEEGKNNYLGYERISSHYTNAEFKLAVQFERNKKIDNQKATDWKFKEFIYYESKMKQVGTLIKDTNIYTTMHRFGFDKIYQKPKTVIERDYFTDASILEFENNINQALTDVFMGKANCEENLLKLCTDMTVRDGWLAHVNEIKRKAVKFENIKLYTQDIIDYARGKDEFADLSLRIYYSRESWKKNKSLKSVYKAAGMSKEVLAQGGWLQKSSVGGKMQKIVAQDNQLKIASFPEKENSIKF